MKALSVRQPWAWLIVNGFKDVENRTWETAYRGRIYIHAGRLFDTEGYEYLTLRSYDPKTDVGKAIEALSSVKFTMGAIIGEVAIVGCEWNYKSPWAAVSHWHWVLKNPIAYEKPIPCRGRLGLFEPEIVNVGERA